MCSKPIISSNGKPAIFSMPVPAKGISVETSNRLPLSKTTGKLKFICPVCENIFYKPVAWAKRTSNHFCSRACASAGRIVRYEIPCVICGKIMSLRFSNIIRVTTCSKICSSKRRRGAVFDKRGFAIYKKAVKELTANPVCGKCGSSHGPWRVRNLEVIFNEDGEACLNKEKVEVWCEHCHLNDIALLGGLCRQDKACSINSKN